TVVSKTAYNIVRQNLPTSNFNMDPSQKRTLDKEYVSEIVGQPINSYFLSEGSKKGDNVIGKMLSVEVETENEEKLHLAIKSLLPLVGDCDAASIGQAHFVTQLQVFPTELAYYTTARPLLQKVTGLKLDKPKFYSGCSDGLNDYIALEDLRNQGYKMADKKKGLNLPQVFSTLKNVAQLHAHAYAVIESNNETMNEAMSTSPLSGHTWGRSIFGLDQSLFFNSIIQKMVELLKEIGEEESAKKTERFADEGHKILLDLWRKTGQNGTKYFRTLIHGDLWINNLLFKGNSDGESVEDIAFIDFQQCRFGNIYEELHYFFFTSTTADFRKTHLRTCLQTYFQNFESILQGLNTEMPRGFTVDELIATFYENVEYGFAYDLVGIPFQLGEPIHDSPTPGNQQSDGPSDQQLDVEGILKGAAEGLKQGAKNSPIAIQRLKELTKEMIKLNCNFPCHTTFKFLTVNKEKSLFTMDQWDYASGLLLPGENVIGVQANVRLYNGDDKIQAKNDTGRATLTTHRFLWETTALKASFSLAKVQRLDKESKGFTSVFSGKCPKIVIHVVASQKPPSAATSPFINDTHATFFKLGFTQGGLDEFLTKVADTLRQKVWEKKAPVEQKRRMGILGIERDIKDEFKKTDQKISEAFHDLKSLMEMAKPMVQLAKNISNRAAKQAASNPEDEEDAEALQFRKQLLSLGIEEPVTKKSYSKKDEYHLHLAMEICSALDKLVLEAGGMMTLVEAYCRINRARGVHVISPHDLMGACQMLKKAPNATLTLREFDTKVKILQHISFDDDLQIAQALSLVEERGSVTPDEYAIAVGVPIFIGKQSLIMAEGQEKLCRDESVEGLRFYPNLFLNEGIEAS
ncbi:Vacuolar protein-sorting-associated protein 36, partial [Orchesella cincta]